MKLRHVERIKITGRDEFINEVYPLKVPVIIENLSQNWKAEKKWSLEWFKNNYGHIQVPVWSNTYKEAGKNYLSADNTIAFSEYIDSLKQDKTQYRMFLYNIIEHVPALLDDIKLPNILDGINKDFVFLFFGYKGARVPLHHDLDYASLFHTQFEGLKKFTLFGPEQSHLLYRHPFTVQSEVDLHDPDYLKKWPAVKNALGWTCILKPGETLYMPSQYWHYIEYLNPGFGMTIRAHENLFRKIQGYTQIGLHGLIDKPLNKISKNYWKKTKHYLAHKISDQYQ